MAVLTLVVKVEKLLELQTKKIRNLIISIIRRPRAALPLKPLLKEKEIRTVIITISVIEAVAHLIELEVTTRSISYKRLLNLGRKNKIQTIQIVINFHSQYNHNKKV